MDFLLGEPSCCLNIGKSYFPSPRLFGSKLCNRPPSSMSGEYIYSGGFWDSKACAVCARWDRSGAAAPNSAPKIVWQFLEPSLVLLQQSTDQSEKSCEDNLPVSSNISKPNSAPKRCDRIGSASVATWVVSFNFNIYLRMIILGSIVNKRTKQTLSNQHYTICLWIYCES